MIAARLATGSVFAVLIFVTFAAVSRARAQPATGTSTTRVVLPTFGFLVQPSDEWVRQAEMGERAVFRASLVRDKQVVSAVDVRIVDGSITSPAQYAERVARAEKGVAEVSPVEIAGQRTMMVTIESSRGAVRVRRMYVVEREPWMYQVLHMALDGETGRAEVEQLLRTIELRAPEPPHRYVSFNRVPLRMFTTDLGITLPDPLRPRESKDVNTLYAVSHDFSDDKGGMTLIAEYKAERADDMNQVVRTLQQRVKDFFKLAAAPQFTRVRSDPDVYVSEPFVDATQADFKPHMMTAVVAPDAAHQIVFTFMLGEKDKEEVDAHAAVARKIAESISRGR